MRKQYLLLPLLILLPLVGCSRADYETYGRLNKEMTLFSEEISLPLGNVGPIQVKDLLNASPTISGLVNQMMKEKSDGTLYVESEYTLYTMNAYEFAFQIPDVTQPYLWKMGDQTVSISTPATLISYFGFKFPNQTLKVDMRNPLRSSIPTNGTVKIESRGDDFSTSYSAEVNLEDYSLPSSYSATTIAEFAFPEGKMDMISTLALNDFTLALPANVQENARTGNDANFELAYRYQTNVAPGSNFSFAVDVPLDDLNLKIGKFKLRKGSVSFDLESTLPLDVTVQSVKLLDPSGNEIPNVTVSSDVQIAGGTLAKPAVTPLVLNIEALEGSIPDIGSISISIAIKCAEGAAGTPLSTKMGLSVKSAAATLRGGITVFGNE